MLKFILPILVYLIVCVVVVLFPTSADYDTFGWKLFVGQIYAIPSLLISALVSFFLSKRLSSK